VGATTTLRVSETGVWGRSSRRLDSKEAEAATASFPFPTSFPKNRECQSPPSR